MRRRIVIGALALAAGVAVAAPTAGSTGSTDTQTTTTTTGPKATKLVRVTIRRRVRRHVRERFHSHHYAGYETTYSEPACDGSSGGYSTAHGTGVHFGEVANDSLPAWTLIELDRPIHGDGGPARRDFRVEDTFGSGQPAEHLDVWVRCGWVASYAIGFRTYHYEWRWRWRWVTRSVWRTVPAG